MSEDLEWAAKEQARMSAIEKPSDAEILGLLAQLYGVPVSKVTEWLQQMNLPKEPK